MAAGRLTERGGPNVTFARPESPALPKGGGAAPHPRSAQYERAREKQFPSVRRQRSPADAAAARLAGCPAGATLAVFHRPLAPAHTGKGSAVDWNSSCAQGSSARTSLCWCCPRPERWSTDLAPLAVPICTRAAIHLTGKVVSFLSRTAMTSLPGSLRRRTAKSDSGQPRRESSSERMRLAFCSAVSRWSSPEWFSPCSPNKRSTRIQPGRCSGADRYQPKLLHVSEIAFLLPGADRRSSIRPSPSPVPCRQSGPAGACATDGVRTRRAESSRCGQERQFLGVFEHGHRLLPRDVWKTIQVLVQAEAAFKIGEQAVHRHTCALKARRPAKALRINPDRHPRRIAQWQARFHLVANLAE